MSRDFILNTVRKNQPELIPLPEIPNFDLEENLLVQFIQITESIGSEVISVTSLEDIKKQIPFQTGKEYITSIDSFSDILNINSEAFHTKYKHPQDLKNIELAILSAEFGVAENGAVWLTDKAMGQRILPFITQHLAIILNKKDIVANMHQAYTKIGEQEYNFGLFLAGPSKTADIEQSLVIGAHGARSLTIYLIEN